MTTTEQSAEQTATLVRLLRVAYPHPSFPDEPYQRCADSIHSQAAADRWLGIQLSQGLDALDAKAGGRFADLTDADALALLRDIESAGFFTFIRGAAVVALYNDPQVWDLLGYEGPSFDKGGYLHRGFDDLDWLPDPRVTEYDGPHTLVEVAPGDQPDTPGQSTTDGSAT